MPRERTKRTAIADAAGRRPAAAQRHKKTRKFHDSGARPPRPLPRDLVGKPVLQKLKYANSYWEFQENKEKKKKLEFSISNDKTPPAGFTFVPVGNPELSRACKELSREEGAMIFIVSATKEQNRNVFDHVQRIGFHFRSYIVDQAASTLGGMQAVTGDGLPTAVNAGDKIPETQIEINKQADAALRDLFPRIPNTDREMIIQHAFQKGAIFHGKPVVGLQPELTLSRRVQLAANAHIRHTHTRYDQLLRETDYINARRVVEPICLDVIMKWRGDEETGRDQLDEILREVVVIPDSDNEEIEEEESASDEDEVQFLREVIRAPLPQANKAPSRSGSRFHIDDPRRNAQETDTGGARGTYTAISTRTRSKANPKPAPTPKDKLARRGFKRYQAWEDAQKRQEAGRPAHTGLPSADDQRRNNSRQANRPASSQAEFLPVRDDRRPVEEYYLPRGYVVDNQQRHPEQLPVSRPPEAGHYMLRGEMVRSDIYDKYKFAPAGFGHEHARVPVIEAEGYWSSEASRGQEQRPVGRLAMPHNLHGVLPSIEPVDLSSDKTSRGSTPAMINARQMMNAPYRGHEEEVSYIRREPEPRHFRPLPVRSNVAYVDETDGLPKRRRVVVDAAGFELSHPSVEYVRLRQVPHQDDHLFPSTSSMASQAIDARHRNEPFSQRVVDDQSSMPQLVPPREARLVRRVSEQDAAFGKLSLNDHPSQHPFSEHEPRKGESQAPKRQRMQDHSHLQDAGPVMFRDVDSQRSSMSQNRPLPLHQQAGAYGAVPSSHRHIHQEQSHYQRHTFVPRSQPEYQSQISVPMDGVSRVSARPMPAACPYDDNFGMQSQEHRRIPQGEQQFRQDNMRSYEQGRPRHLQLRPQGRPGEVSRYEPAPGPAPSGPKMYSRSTPLPGEVIVLD